MQSYQYFIDDIQSAVYSPETADPDFLRDAAAQYAEACAEANERLRQVGKLLHRGLRGEALQLAEEEPNLLDFVAMLDFSELRAWRELLRQWGMAAPPKLLIELASEINQAYADQQPVESLLKQHRLLALARAPLAARIRTLRNIRRTDVADGAWEEDLKALENARLRQIDREAEASFRRDELSHLSAIKAELDTDDWLLEKPKAVVHNVNHLHKSLSEKLARLQLEELAQKLNAAHMSFDVEAGLKTRQLWDEAAQVASLKPDEVLAEKAAPALDWLRDEETRHTEQKKRNMAFRALEEALDASAPAAELSRLYEAALVFDEPLPVALNHRAEQRLAAYALTARRRHRVVLTLIVSLVLAAGGLITYLIVQQAHRARVAGVAAALSSMVDERRLEEAQEYYDKTAELSPVVVSNTDVQAQASRLNEAVKGEQDRRAQFENAITRAAHSPATSPNRAALAEAQQLARTAAEKQRVGEIETNIAIAEGQIQQEHNETISQRLAEFRERLTRIESSPDADGESTLSLLAALSRDINDAPATFPKASSAVVDQLQPLAKRIKAIRQSIESEQKQAIAKDRMTQAVGDSVAYVGSLKAYAAAFPTSSTGLNSDTLSKELPLWEGLSSWDLFLASAFPGSGQLTSQQAREWLAKGEQLETRFGDVPLAEVWRSRKAYLQSVASREPANEAPIIEELRKLLRDPLVGNLWMVQRKDGLRYYARREPVAANGSFHFQYLAGFDLTEKATSVPEGDVDYRGRAPQSLLAEKVLVQLGQLPTRGWEASFTKIVQSTLNEDRLEPILKTTLLQRTLKVATEGSSVLRDAFDQYRQDLDAGNVDMSVKWMEPRDPTATRERVRAEVLLTSLPPITNAIRIAATKYREIREPPEHRYCWIGWLGRGANGNWQVVAKEPISGAGKLVIIERAPGGKAVEIKTVGDVEDGAARVNGASPSLLIEGRPVFQIVPQNAPADNQ